MLWILFVFGVGVLSKGGTDVGSIAAVSGVGKIPVAAVDDVE